LKVKVTVAAAVPLPQKDKPQAVLLHGDLAYADDYQVRQNPMQKP